MLSIIASSPTEIQPVLDAIAEKAVDLAGTGDVSIWLVRSDVLERRAQRGSSAWAEAIEPLAAVPLGADSAGTRAVSEGRTVHIHDRLAEPPDNPEVRAINERIGVRTTLAAPLLREGVPIGAMLIQRREVKPFTEKEIRDRKSTRLNSSHIQKSRMPSSA